MNGYFRLWAAPLPWPNGETDARVGSCLLRIVGRHLTEISLYADPLI